MKNRGLGAGWLMLVGALSVLPAHAQDLRAGYDKSRFCANCHGLDGIAVAANAPNLAGENASYIKAQLRAFREGKRQHHQMSLIAAGLSDQDIADLALWFSRIKVTATIPELD